MATPAEFNTAIENTVEDSAKMRAIVQGAADDPDVETLGGLVPPIAKKLAEMDSTFVKPIISSKIPASTKIVFVCDDGADTDYTVLRPIFSNNSAALTTMGLTPGVYEPCFGTLGLVSNEVDTGGNLSAAQALQMQTEGWELASHSKTHSHVVGGSYEDKLEQIKGSKDQLAGLGIYAKNYVWPYGESDAEMRQIAARSYRSAVAVVTTGARRHIGPIPQFALHRYGMETDSAWQVGDIATVGGGGVGTYSTLQDRKNLVDAAVSEGGMLIFMVHSAALQSTAGRMQMLIDLLEYIQGLEGYGDTIEISTLDDALETHGNKIQAGDYIPEPSAGTPPPVSRLPYIVVGANNVEKVFSGQETVSYEEINSRSNSSLASAFSMGKITLIPFTTAQAVTASMPGSVEGILHTYRLFDGDYSTKQMYYPYGVNRLWMRFYQPGTSTWSSWVLMMDENTFPSASMTIASGAGVAAILNFTQNSVNRGKIECGYSGATNTVFWSGSTYDRAVVIGAGNRHNLNVGWSSIATSAPEEGILSHSDIVVNTSTKGLVLKSPNNHYWRGTISDAGVLTWTDLGTSSPG